MSLVHDKAVLDAISPRYGTTAWNLVDELAGKRPLIARTTSGRKVYAKEPMTQADVRRTIRRLAARGEIRTYRKHHQRWVLTSVPP